jgi:hypothetical protein
MIEERKKELREKRKTKAAKKKEVLDGCDPSDFESVQAKLRQTKKAQGGANFLPGEVDAGGSRPQGASAMSNIRVEVMKTMVNDKKPKGIQIEHTTVAVRKGGETRKKTTARLAPIVKN